MVLPVPVQHAEHGTICLARRPEFPLKVSSILSRQYGTACLATDLILVRAGKACNATTSHTAGLPPGGQFPLGAYAGWLQCVLPEVAGRCGLRACGASVRPDCQSNSIAVLSPKLAIDANATRRCTCGGTCCMSLICISTNASIQQLKHTRNSELHAV